MVASADDVAAALLEATGPMTAMKLQKLTYYVQAWHLASHGTPAFEEDVEAWRDGPVVRRLYDQHRNRRELRDWGPRRAIALGETVRAVLVDVVARYGALTAEQLSQISHREAPWRKARGDLPEGASSNVVIDRADMIAFYGRQAGRPSTAVQDAVASARLEGAEAGEEDVRLLERVAAGELSADEAVRQALRNEG